MGNSRQCRWDGLEQCRVISCNGRRPISFIQELYAPYHLNRPIIPLSIAGFAQAKTYESGISDIYYDEREDIEMSKEVLLQKLI